MARICLNMIVKNESSIILDTLDNILKYIPINYWVICDTGSSDGTQEKIKSFFSERNIEGELHQDEWVNFSINRNLALNRCLGKSDYIFIFDADDRFTGDFILPNNLNKDAYSFRLSDEGGGLEYYRNLLIKNSPEVKWRSVIHEYLDFSKDFEKEYFSQSGYKVISGRFGARSQDPKKYYKDAIILEDAFLKPEDEDLKPRYAFYCAQSYKDADMNEEAIIWYKKRIELGGWIEEVTCAYENLGRCYERLGKPQEALNTWLMGYDYNPARAECLYNAVRLLRIQGNCRLGYQLAKVAIEIPYPVNDVLFIQRDIYSLWIYYELSICAYYANDFQTGYECCKKVLFANPNLIIMETTINNLRFYQQYAEKDKTDNIRRLIEIIHNYSIHNDNLNADNILVYLRSLT